MVKLILHPILVFICATAMAAECDQRLTHNLTRGTLRLLERGVVGVSEIAAMVNSDRPINPLRARTPGSRDSAAMQFFNVALDGRIDQEQWDQIRAELRLALAGQQVQTEVRDEAREETREVPSLVLVNSNDSPSHKITQFSGVYYFQHGKGQEDLLRSALRQEPIWRGEAPYRSYGAFTEVNGKPVFNFFSQPETTFAERLKQGLKTKVLRRTIDLEGGQETDSVIWQWRKESNISNLERVAFKADRMATTKLMKAYETRSDHVYKISIFENGKEREESWSRLSLSKRSPDKIKYDFLLLKNGKLAVTAYHAGLDGAEPEFGKIQFRMTGGDPIFMKPGSYDVAKESLFETNDGRVLVAVSTERKGLPLLQIFEPLKGSEPVFEFASPGPSSQHFEYEFFERKGVLYLMLAQRGSSDLPASVYLLAPLESAAPLMNMTLPPFGDFRVAIGPDGEPYVILDRRTLDTYSIFQKK